MDPPLGRYDSEEVRLGPKSYQWTRSLLSDQKTTAPTRFDLFHVRKEFEAFLTAARRGVEAKMRSELKFQQIYQMHTTLLECANLYRNEIGHRQATMEKIEKLVESKVLTRSMTAKIEKLESDISAIFNELVEKLQILNEVTELDNLGRLPELLAEWLNKLNDRILATIELRDQVLHYLER